jgi:hypothetical protein
MKIKIEIDLTPIEARKFFGLPDVEPLQEAMMEQLQEQMSKSLQMMDPEAMLRSWLPLGAQGIENFQRMMWSAAKTAMDAGARVAGSGRTGDKDKDRDRDK